MMLKAWYGVTLAVHMWEFVRTIDDKYALDVGK